MADEVLSQAEVESLLSAMESHTARTAAAAPAGAAPSIAGTARPPLRPRDKVTPYDSFAVWMHLYGRRKGRMEPV